jgi:tyrocidine synthetase-3
MKKTEDFLFNLRREKNISITVDNGQLSLLGSKKSLDPSLIEEIKLRKQEILKYFESQQKYSLITVPYSEKRDKYALSSAQKRVFFEKELNSQSIAYNLPVVVKLKGNLDIKRFEQAFLKIIQRHEILRTSFEVVKGEIFQRIHSEIDFKITSLKEKREISSIVEDFIRPFDLSQSPLFRIGLFDLAANEYLLVFDIHHIITDGISNSLLIQEFVTLYHQKSLPAPKLQYRDYAEWQQGKEFNDIIAYQKGFWKNEFAESQTPLELPVDHLRSSNKPPSAGSVNIVIEGQNLIGLKGISVKLEATQYSILLTVYYILLSKLSNQKDITIGTVTTGRFNEQVDPLLGMFVNTLPLRNFPKAELSFKEFLDNVKFNVASCFDHQMYQFENLVSDLNVNRDSSRNPLFDVFFAYQNYDRSNLEISDLSIEPVNVGVLKTIFDIELTASEFDTKIALSFTYNANLFKQVTIERYGAYFDKIVSQVISNPDIQLSEIDVLGFEERKQLLIDFNSTELNYPKEKTIIDLFEEQVKKTPGNVAVRFDEKIMTYLELKDKSDRIASYLQQIELVNTGDLVGLLLEREEELLPCIFGIMKSGAVYVPLSTGYPSARLNAMIADAGLKVLITRRQYLDTLAIEMESGLLDLDTSLEKINELKHVNLKRGAGANDLAYVIHTSGSTGKPKGVMIEHHSVINRLLWMQKKYALTEKDVLLQKTSLVFDVSIWELFWWSFTGASVCLLPPEGEKDPKKIIQEIEKNKVTTVHFVPSMLNAFLDEAEREKNDSLSLLRQVFSSGEALAVDHVNKFSRSLHDKYGTRLVNLYGPTEATVDVSYYECDFSKENESIPIGKPIDNIRLYIVDENVHLTPMGVVGELCIAGAGLARGYLNNADLTADKFINVFFNQKERLYRTGDLACWLPDGTVKFLGRIDDQIKIRGYRIELGEIENHLLLHKSVKEAVVTLSVEKYLVAHYVADSELDKEELKRHLYQMLPEYMVPQHYVYLTEMPLTSNGKLDRKTLSKAEVLIQSEYVAPRNELEQKMTKVWAEVLGLETIGITDDYFSLGGDSIKAIKLIYEINEQLGCNLKLASLYTHKTVESITSLVFTSDEKSNQTYLEAKAEIERFQKIYKEQNDFPSIYEEVYPMSGIERGMVYYTMLKDENEQRFDNIIYHEQNHYHIPYPDLRFDVFKKALNLLVDKHETLRKIYDTDNLAHIVLKTIEPEVYYIDLTVYTRTEQEEYWKKKITTERLRASGFPKQILWRMNLLKISDNFHYLIFDMHHSVFDGWSIHAFLTELNNTYFKLIEDSNYLPVKLESSYYDHILGEIMDMKDASSSSVYWQNELKDYNRYRFPKFDQEHRFITKEFTMNRELKSELKALAAKLDTNIKDLSFSAFAYTMGMLSYNKEFVIGYSTNNRPSVKDGEKLLGCFLNQIPFNVSIPSNGSWGDFIQYMAEKNRSLKAHERLPFYKILEVVHESSQKGVNPVFDLAFNYIDFWIVGDMVRPSDSSHENPGFWHDGNDVNQNTLFDFHLHTTMDAFFVVMEYSTTILNEHLVNVIFECFQNVLNKFIHHTNEPANPSAIFQESERKALLYDFNDTGLVYPSDKTVIDLFLEQVAKHADKPAVRYLTNELSYGELDRRSTVVAQHLKAKGVGVEDLVGILLEPSDQLLISILGVLKCGGAFVPIDKDYPVGRKRHMLEQSGLRAMISTEALLGENSVVLEKLSLSDILDVSAVDFTIAVEESSLPGVSPGDLAYVLYTSGSTGLAKGVMITHGALYNYLNWARDTYIEEGADCPMALFSSISFDLTITSMFLPLISGNALRVYEQRDHSALIGQVVADGHARVLKLTPSHLKILKESAADLRGIRCVVVGGEQFDSELACWLKAIGGDTLAIYNEYGPTEATVGCVIHRYEGEDSGRNSVLIGKPAPNNQIYIFDQGLSLLPVGVEGEVYIGGAQLFRGYISSAEQTASRLIPHPNNPGELLYRTGDLARWLPDGNMEFLGRIDEQVKIRGYRIELGEIEHHLASHPGIEASIVVAREKDGSKYLVGYYVSAEALPAADMQNYLSDYLPEYMVPAIYVHLASMPLTLNGKIDRKALPDPELSSKSNDYVAPRTKVEKLLCEVWSEVLRIENIGITDNFYSVGGDSIRSIQICSKIKKAGYKLTVQDLITDLIIEKIAARITHDIEDKEDAHLRRKIEDEFTKVREKINAEGTVHEVGEIEDVYPMSDIQKGMTFHSMKENGTGTYHDQMLDIVELKNFNLGLFEKSLLLLVEKHAILKTGFHLDQGEERFLQIVYKTILMDFRYEDISHLSTADQRSFMENEFATDLKKPFELSAPGVLWRYRVYSLGEDLFAMCFIFHHAIIDGWSRASFNTELKNTYLKLKQDIHFIPTVLKTNYKDHVIEQQVYRRTAEVADFWKNELLDYERFSFSDTETKEQLKFVSEVFSEEFYRRLSTYAREQSMSIKSVCYSAFLYCLNLFSHKNDLTIGLITNNRPVKEDGEKILGCFLNTIPFRFSVPEDRDISWEELTRMVQEKLNLIKKYDQTSLMSILEIIGESTTNENPIFDITLSYVDFHIYDQLEGENGPITQQKVDKIRALQDFTFERTNSKFELVINTTGQVLVSSISYVTSFISEKSANDFLQYFSNILKKIVNTPQENINRDEILPKEIVQHLLYDFNDTGLVYPSDKTVIDLFLEQVAKHADKPAVRYLTNELSYGELDRRSTVVAQHLKAKGVGVEDLVGILLEPSDQLLISILGVLKCGGAFVPIDKDYPVGRKRHMLEQSGLRAMISTEALLGENSVVLEKLSLSDILDVSAVDFTIAVEESSLPGVSPGDLAYVLYTSGSTGLAKGVMITHGALYNYLNWARDTYIEEGADCPMALFSSISFDLTITSMFLPLISGNALRVYEQRDHSALIGQVVADGHARVLKLTPSHLKILKESAADLRGIRCVVVGGEQFDSELACWLKAIGGDTLAIYNEYGPTEATVGCVIHRYEGEDSGRNSVLIGKPAPNNQIYIFDQGLSLLPVGVEGEVYIGGAQLFRGYISSAEQTASRLIPHPNNPGELLYRTGDLARWLPDGNMEFLGRIDEQVKIRGYRIELGEIEHHLTSHPGIEASVVVAREKDGSKYLVGYYVSAEALPAADMQNYLSDYLPEYMVPAIYVHLAGTPLTLNGKIDRKALPDPEFKAGGDYVAPGNEVEEKLAEIWSQVLQVDKGTLSINKSFFKYGGDSLNLIALTNAIFKQLNVSIPIMEMFDKPSIQEQAEIIVAINQMKSSNIDDLNLKEVSI